jgi:hypothetical protein
VLVAEVRDSSVELVPVEAHEVHASALRNKEPRGCESDAALPACDERHLVGKTSHTTPLRSSITHVRAADAPLNPFARPSRSQPADATHTGNTRRFPGSGATSGPSGVARPEKPPYELRTLSIPPAAKTPVMSIETRSRVARSRGENCNACAADR